MKRKWIGISLLLIFLLLCIPAPVKADGIIIPPLPPCREGNCPPRPRPMAQLEIRYHHVTVKIDNQLAITHVDQVFFNPNSWPIEGVYIFPLPLDAAVSNFTMWVDGKPVAGKVLSAEEARSYYEETVRNLRDPALLEYAGRGAVQASVFPILPQGERRIELEYSQALTAQNGLVRYVYPLNTEKFSVKPLQDASVSVEIHDKQSIRAVYSPSYSIGLDRRSDHEVIAGYEAKDLTPDTDFTLYYSLGESEAFHLLTYRDPADPADPDGFFLMLLAPRPDVSQETVAKDVLLVLDHSGSMDGNGKFQQAQAALRFILKKLNPEDRFYLQAFSTGIETYADGLRPASEANEALGWVDRLRASGSTDINRALLEAAAVADKERPTYLIFLTDGLPTEGVVDTNEILKNFAAVAPSNLRLFAFGLGYDVDTVLLDSLSQEHHGQSTYVRPDEALDETLSSFYERISTPVLTNLALDFGSLAAYDIYPDPLPDLFSGSQVIVVGRYHDGGSGDIVLSGEVNGKRQEFRYPGQEFTRDSRGDSSSLDALPRLWATRKIGYLLNQIRLEGPDKETIQQIVRLSVRYGIVTPYTSYLVTEPVPLGVEEQNRIANDAYGQAEATPLEVTGKSAVERANQEGQMKGADVAPAAPSAQGGQAGAPEGSVIRVVGSRTFIYQNSVWVDTLFDPQKMTPQKVLFLSQEYYQLLDVRPDLASALALGDQVILVVDGKAYQIVIDEKAAGPVNLPPTITQPTQVVTPQLISPGETSQPGGAQAPTSPVKPATSQPGMCYSVGLASLAIMALFLRKKARQ